MNIIRQLIINNNIFFVYHLLEVIIIPWSSFQTKMLFKSISYEDPIQYHNTIIMENFNTLLLIIVLYPIKWW